MTRKRMLVVCGICVAYCHPSSRSLMGAVFAEAIRFFSSGRGANRKEYSVDCTETWLSEMTLLWFICRASFHRDKIEAPINLRWKFQK